jgi:hypothetical protein
MKDGQKVNDFSIRQCCIVTNLTHIDLDKMVIQLKDRKCIEKWAYIIHDKDTYTEEDEKKNPDKKEGKLKEKHIHLMLKFTSPQKARLVTQWFNLPINMLSKIKGKWMTALIYLTHGNNPEKAQYDFEDVKTNGFDYEDAIDINQINPSSTRKVREKEIIELINSEVVREYNISKYFNAEEYNTHNKAIKNTFTYVQEKLEMLNKGRDMKVIYIKGESGCGKTTYARMIADNKDYSYYVSSSSNDVLDGYKGQDCLILDDFRDTSLTFPDLLKLLDNHTNSSVKSRFKNKNLVYCKLVIITSTQSLDWLLKNIENKKDEDVTQLKRRIGLIVELTKEEMDCYKYDFTKKEHLVFSSSLVNPTIEHLNKLKKNEDAEKEEYLELLTIGDTPLKKSNLNVEDLLSA